MQHHVHFLSFDYDGNYYHSYDSIDKYMDNSDAYNNGKIKSVQGVKS